MKNFISFISEASVIDRSDEYPPGTKVVLKRDGGLGKKLIDEYGYKEGQLFTIENSRTASNSNDIDENTKLIDSLGYKDGDIIPAVEYHISFYNDMITPAMAEEIANFMNVDKSVIENGVYDLSFARMEGTIEKVAIPFRRGGTWMMKKVGSAVDDDLSRLSTKEAVAVFGTVLAASLDFVQRKNPAGIYYGIKKNAKMARSRIYDRIAHRNGGRLISLPDRKSMKGVRLVWFR